MGKERIAVVVPCAWDVTGGVAVFMVNLVRLSAEPSCPFEFQVGIKQNYRPADYARNVAVLDVLDDKSISRLWFVDSDVLPRAKTLLPLLHCPDDIVGGSYEVWGKDDTRPEAHPTTTTYMEAEGGGWNPAFIQGEGFARVDAIGTGMMIIRRHVLEDERMWHDGVRGALFRNIYGPLGNIVISEDMDFCKRARALGYTISAHSHAKVGHVKTVNVEDIVAYAASEASKNGGSPSLSVHTP